MPVEPGSAGPFASEAADQSEATLVGRALAGEEDAFAEIYRRYHALVYRFARMMSGHTPIAEEITQDTFVALIGDLPRYDGRRSSLPTYLYGIARNLTRNRLRRERRFVPWSVAPPPEPRADANQDRALIQDEEMARLRAAIDRLPDRYREVLILEHLHCLPSAEIATIVGVPIGTIRSRLSRARAMVRMARSALVPLGIQLPDPEASGLVDVDVIVGEDGLAQSIHRITLVSAIQE